MFLSATDYVTKIALFNHRINENLVVMIYSKIIYSKSGKLNEGK
jgi:hypothetical protein